MRALLSVPLRVAPAIDPLASPARLLVRSKQRTLRTFRRAAIQPHFCDRCFRDIEPGRFYEGLVEIDGAGRFRTWKRHVDPDCEWPTDPGGENDREWEMLVGLQSAA